MEKQENARATVNTLKRSNNEIKKYTGRYSRVPTLHGKEWMS